MVNKSRLRAAALCTDLFVLCLLRSRRTLLHCLPLLNRTTLCLRENEPCLPLRPPISGAGTSTKRWERAKTGRIYGKSRRTKAKVNGPLKVHAALYIQVYIVPLEKHINTYINILGF